MLYKVRYADGDEEEMDAVEMKPMLLAHAERPAQNPTPNILQAMGQNGEGGSPFFPGAGGEAAADTSNEAGESGVPYAS